MWCDRFAHDPIVVRCLAEPHACVRGAVHIFLLQSVPAECVQDCVRAGCSSLQASFWGSTWRFCPRCRHAPWLRITGPAWSAMCTRPKSGAVGFEMTGACRGVAHLCRMASASRRPLAGREFSFDGFDTCSSSGSLRTRAVVINMDEASLGNVKQWKRGVAAFSGEAHLADTVAKEAVMPRTNLAASVCSDVAIQAKLPQIRLPRGRGGKLPSRIVASCCAEAESPQVAVHGSSGYCTVPTLSWYMRLVARAVRSERPECVPALVMDCCPVHLVEKVLADAS